MHTANQSERKQIQRINTDSKNKNRFVEENQISEINAHR